MYQSIIDFHTHTFPDRIAARAIQSLSESSGMISYLEGTDAVLSQEGTKSGISLSVVLPVATKPGQAEKINLGSMEKNLHTEDTGLLFFGAVHPSDENKKQLLKDLKSAGFRGIKLHPVFQNVAIDDPENLEILDTASDLGLITVIHAGYDISYPDNDLAGVPRLLHMIETVHPANTVLAHMGGWMQWDNVEHDLAGADVFFDTSFSLTPLCASDGRTITFPGAEPLTNAQFSRIVKKHGTEKILFGTDSPWSGRTESVNAVMKSGLSSADLEMIFSKNARALLKR